MQPLADALSSAGAFLNAGIAGSEFTPLKLIIVITLISALVWRELASEGVLGPQSQGALALGLHLGEPPKR